MKKMLLAGTATLLVSAMWIPSAHANDSTAALGLGGLVLTQNDAVSMDSEDLYLSAEQVRVKYEYTNHTGTDVQTLVSFPLPPMPFGNDDEDMATTDLSDMEFTTLVDGKDVQLMRMEKITVSGRPDLSDTERYISQRGWPLHYWNDNDFMAGLWKLPKAVENEYLASGYFVRDGSEGIRPNWIVNTHVTRLQTFPAGKTITVEHSYTPFVGGSVAGSLHKSMRRADYGWNDYIKRYCVDKNFLAGFDTRQAKLGERAEHYYETWLDYILSSGANWKGPIKKFRLIVDKGSSDNLVSFCMDGVKKISPTQFEVRKTNFEPKNDLHILIVKWFQMEQ